MLRRGAHGITVRFHHLHLSEREKTVELERIKICKLNEMFSNKTDNEK